MRDNTNDLIGFKYNDNSYYYIKNAQNDIIGILDSNYNIVAKYKYNSWGVNIKITDGIGNDIQNNLNHIANINPFRYRSYYYDTETKLYYLNSRYYNPLWVRFLNSDNIIIQNNMLLGNNLYAYCNNNSINSTDYTGHFVIKWLAKKAWGDVSKALEVVGMNTSAKFIKHATKKNPNDLYFKDDSNVAKQIKNDTKFKEKVKKITNELNTGKVDASELVTFSSLDLQGSFHEATVNISGNVVNGCGLLDINVYDKYDFDFETGYFNDGLKGFVFTVGNNMAWSDQYFDVINSYKIYVDFQYNPCQ